MSTNKYTNEEQFAGLFPSSSAEQLFDEMVMEYVQKQKLNGYIPFYQIRYRVAAKMLEMKTAGKKYFNLPRLIKDTIKEEREAGIKLPEEL